jgi:hypothetical protein
MQRRKIGTPSHLDDSEVPRSVQANPEHLDATALLVAGRNGLTAIDRFWSKVNVRTKTECWTWNAYRDRYGYGRFNFGRKNHQANRFAWKLSNGPIPSGLCVCHRCDNPACVNPVHLFLGTNADNRLDMVNKGRHSTPRGEDCVRSKLTNQIVTKIRSIYRKGSREFGTQALARSLNVAPSLVWRIIARQNWKHIP